MKDHRISLNRNCPCSQERCPIKGNCVLCVQNHLAHRRHLPECIQALIAEPVHRLMHLLEEEPLDRHPDEAFWEGLDVEKFVQESIARHPRS